MSAATTDRIYLANLLGAFSANVATDVQGSVEEAVGAGRTAVLAIETWPGESIDFFARVLGLTHSGTVRLVDRLSAEGLVRRGEGEDGRAVAVRLTARGRARARAARAARYRVLLELVDDMSAGEKRVMGDALIRFLSRQPRTRFEARSACRLCDHTVCPGEVCPVGQSVEES